MIKPVLTSLAVAALFTINANAAGFQGVDETTTAHCKAMRDNVTAKKTRELEAVVPKPANEYYSTGTCLDSILNTRINVFTLPSLDVILDRLQGLVVNRACSAVLGAWNEQVTKANTTIGTTATVPYIGTVGSINVNSSSGNSPININNGNGIDLGNANTTVSTQTSNVVTQTNTAVDKIKNLFQ